MINKRYMELKFLLVALTITAHRKTYYCMYFSLSDVLNCGLLSMFTRLNNIFHSFPK